MVRPEWSPNESYLTKLERLAFALVRTRPAKEQPCDIRSRSKNPWVEKCKGLAGPFALALLVAIPYIAENSSGPIIVASLLLAAVDACLTIWCYTVFESQHGHCNGDLFNCMFNYVGEFPAFLFGWWWISAMSAGFAACARTLSSIMDSVTGNHVETLMENTIGSFTLFGAPMDIISLGIVTVPSIMCSLGMEGSNFLRSAIFALTSTTTLSIFGYALATHHLFPTVEIIPTSIIPDGNLYAKIFSGAALASVGFLGLYTVSKPDNVTLTQHKHFHVSKRFSLTGCLIASAAFLVYFIESTVINRVQQTPSLWDGDPPLLWPLQDGWRLIVASLGIAALSLTTFEFLIPLSLTVTKLANDGLLYRKLKKPINEEPLQWSSTTPLVFGGICALQAMLIDTKVLLGLVSSSLMCIHILVCSAMIALRYQKKPALLVIHKRTGHIQTRPIIRVNSVHQASTCSSSGGHHHHQRHSRRLLAVGFLKNGLGKVPREVVHEIDVCHSGRDSADDITNDRAYLMETDVEITPNNSSNNTRRRESASEFSLGSNVSGYESDTDPNHSDGADDTDIDAVVTEYQEEVRVATLNGAMPNFPTAATGRRVALSLLALVPCCLAMAASLNRAPRGQFTGIMLGISSGLLTFLLLVVISRQPQRQRRRVSTKQVPPQSGPNPNNCSLSELESRQFLLFLIKQSFGLIIYFSYSVTKSVAAPNFTIPSERIRLNGTPRQSLMSTVVCGNDPSTATTSTSTTSAAEPYTQIDTVLMA